MALVPSAAREGKSIRLLWLIDSLTLGGAEALTVSFTRSVDTSRVRPRVVCLKTLGGNPYEARLREEGVPVVPINSCHLRDLTAFRRLIRFIREEQIDLIHAHLTDASIWGALAGRLTARPLVATLHTAPLREAGWSRPLLRQRLHVGLLNRWASRVLAVSNFVKSAWVSQAGLDPGRTVVVHNGIDIDSLQRHLFEGRRQAVRRELGLPAGETLVITVSALREGKGIDRLIEAIPRVLSRVPGVRFLVVGEGPSRAALEERARALGLGARLWWAGYRTDVGALLSAADLFVLPSIEDAFPTALLEAMAAGLPVVATRVGGIPEILGPDGAADLVPPGDEGALADAISVMLADSKRWMVRGTEVRRRVREQFSSHRWVQRLETIYREAISGRAEAASARREGFAG